MPTVNLSVCSADKYGGENLGRWKEFDSWQGDNWIKAHRGARWGKYSHPPGAATPPGDATLALKGSFRRQWPVLRGDQDVPEHKVSQVKAAKKFSVYGIIIRCNENAQCGRCSV